MSALDAREARLAARGRVLARALPARRRALPGALLGILADGCVVGLLGLSMWLIVRAGEQPPILHLTFAIVGVRALAIGRAAFRYVERISSHDAALAQLAVLRASTFEALVPRIPGAIESHRRGEVLAAFVDDVDQLQDEPLRVRQPLIVSGAVVILSLITITLISPLAALVLLVALLASGALAVWLSARMAGRYDRELSAARAGLIDALLERFASAEVLAAFGAVGMQRSRIDRAEARLAEVQLRRARSAGLTGAILTLAAGIASLGTLVVLLPALGTGISAPLFSAAVIVPAAVFEIFAQVPAALAARRAVQASADRVAALTETPLPAEIPVEDPDPATGSSEVPAPVPGAPLLRVRGLSVRHPGAARDAVTGLDFEVAPGETLVITGESGAGKSTLALALVRFLDYGGSYELGGREVSELPIRTVRETVGLCEQTPHLFDADLRQNLKFARDTASDDELLAALARVGLAEWAAERGGLDAPVGEHGALVSGGQAQRIGLARVLLADFPILVLDEPTAGVDRARADSLLSDLLAAVPEDRAVLLITHTELPAGVRASSLELPAPVVR
ncbi:thiol reductant ABC exporter subunit CydC [Leucobacter luti]|uniref:thiol reductant ABC exporter subunit CydC n=1 Tax=Leucobacter luti TaxID=340320 RepID=UPI003D003785